MLVSEPIEGKSGAHLWLIITFIVDIKHTLCLSGENEISCICDTELKYKYISLEVNEGLCTHFILENCLTFSWLHLCFIGF